MTPEALLRVLEMAVLALGIVLVLGLIGYLVIGIVLGARKMIKERW